MTDSEKKNLRLTDLGNCERFMEEADGKLYYLSDHKKWVFYNGKKWEISSTDKEALACAINVINGMYLELVDMDENDGRKELSDHASRCESLHKIKAMINLSKSGLPIDTSRFDKDNWLLNVANGTVNLKTGELLAHNQNHYITKYIPVEYDPDAQCPNWLDFLDIIMDGNSEMVNFLQRAIGYSITGNTGERCVFILHGNGRNGKSTFSENIAYLLNDYAMNTPSDSLLQKKFGDGIPSDIARLQGARFVYASETSYNSSINEARIKALAGDKDTITVRYLHKEWFSFIPNFKLWLHTNHKPNITGTDEAIWDRIRLIPFTVRIPDDKVKYREDIDKVFKEERSGILSWAIEGCRKWQEEGLKSPLVVSKATGEYRDESDPVKEFIEEMCNVDPNSTVTKSDLYKAYEKYCFANGDGVDLKNKDFNKLIKNRGFDTDRESTGERRTIWKGIGLNKENKYNLDLKRIK